MLDLTRRLYRQIQNPGFLLTHAEQAELEAIINDYYGHEESQAMYAMTSKLFEEFFSLSGLTCMLPCLRFCAKGLACTMLACRDRSDSLWSDYLRNVRTLVSQCA